MQLGVGLRTAAGCLTGAFLVALVAGVVVMPLARHGAYPEPFALLASQGTAGDLWTWLWQGTVILVGVALLSRALAVTVGAAGWLLMPEDHRALLGRMAETTVEEVVAERAPAQPSTEAPAPVRAGTPEHQPEAVVR